MRTVPFEPKLVKLTDLWKKDKNLQAAAGGIVWPGNLAEQVFGEKTLL